MAALRRLCLLLLLLGAAALQFAAADIPASEQRLLSQLGVDKHEATVVSNDNTLLSGKSSVSHAAPPAPPQQSGPTTERQDNITPLHERIHEMNHELLKTQAVAMRQQVKDTNAYIARHNQELAENTAAKIEIVRDTAQKHMVHDKALHKQELALEGRHAAHTEVIAQKMHELGVAKAEKLRQMEMASLDLEKQRLDMEKQHLLQWNRNQWEHLKHVADADASWKKVNERKLQNTAEVNKQTEDLEENRNKLYGDHIRRWKVIKTNEIDVLKQQVDDLRTNPPPHVASDDRAAGQSNGLSDGGESGILDGPASVGGIGSVSAGGGISFSSGQWASGGVPLYNAGIAGPAMPVGGGYGYGGGGGGFGGGGMVLSMVPSTSPPPCFRFRSVATLRGPSGLPSTATRC